MSRRNILEDQRALVPGKTTVYGRYFSLTSNGTNQDKTKPLEDHPYTMLLTDKFDVLWKVQNCASPGEFDYGSTACTFIQHHVWGSSDDYELYGKLEKKYDRADFNASVFAGELGESVDMLADRAKQLFNAVRAAKKGRFKQAAHILGIGGSRKVSPSTAKRHRDDAGPQDPQRVSQAWLELQYGWIPLVKDVWKIADQIAQLDKPRKRRIYASHFIGLNPSCSSPKLFETSGGGRHRKQIIAYIHEDVAEVPEALGLMDPELVAWEVVPFSFIVDWFLPVGNYLEARAFATRAKGKFVLTETWKANIKLTGVKPQGPCIQTWGNRTLVTPIGWYKYVSVNRSVTSSLPQVRLPTWSNGIGKGWRLQNAIALAASIFGGSKLPTHIS